MTGGKIMYNRSKKADSNVSGVIYGEVPNKNSGSLIQLSNVTLSHNKTDGSGGAICGYRVHLNKCKFIDNSAGINGGAIFTNSSSSELKVKESEFSYNSAVSGGGIYVSGNCQIDGSLLEHNYASSTGGGIYSTGPTTISNSFIRNNWAMSTETGYLVVNQGRGGGFCFAGNKTKEEPNAIQFVLDNTEVYENACMYYGGGGQLQDGGKLTIKNNTKINKNTSVLDGAAGLHLTGGVFFYMQEKTEISENIALGGVGGGIHSSYECFIHLNGGKISNNKVYGRGGGVHVNTGGDLVLNGTDITGNEAYDGYNMIASTVTKGTDGKYSWSPPQSNPDNPQPGYGGGLLINSGSCTMNTGNLSENYAQTLGGGIGLIMQESSEGYAKYVRLTTFTLNSGNVSKNITDGNGGGVYLMENILNNLSADKKNTYTQLVNGGDWTPKIILNGGNFSGNRAGKNGGGAYQEQETEFIISSGKNAVISGNRAGYSGGAVYIQKGNFTVNGSVDISNNYADSSDGGAIYIGQGTAEKPSEFFVSSSGTLNLGGSTSDKGNTAGRNGGGVYCAGKFTVDGSSSIKYNNALSGAGIYVDGADVRFTAATELADNTAISHGGGLFVSDGNVTLAADTINGNSAANGGAIYLNTGSFSASGNTTMSSNTASGYGGAVYVSDGDIEISGASSILTLSDNNAVNGGAFYVNNGSIDAYGIKEATITNNYSAAAGGTGGEGGAFYVSNGNIYMCKTDLSGNGKLGDSIKTTKGGAIALYNGEFSFADGSEIKNNAATENGGGLYVSSTTEKNIKCIGGSYMANSSKLGGGIYASGPINLTIAANVRGNAAVNGGGLYLTDGVRMIFGYEDNEKGVVDGLIVDNSATASGGYGGIGGGIYVDKGTLSFYLPSDKAKQKLGIYNNAATYEAADIFSSGNGTTISLPNIGGMNLTGFDVPGSTLYWVKDVHDNRYQTALMNLNANIESMILAFENSQVVKELNDRQCLDLGYDLVYVTLRPVYLDPSDNAAFEISYPLDRDNPNTENIRQYRKVLLNGGKDSIVGLPSGLWNFNLSEWASLYETPTLNPAAEDNGFLNITRNALKPTDGVITITFKKQENKKDIVRYEHIKVNKMTPRTN
jgi:predicted outer membrane repeat protein